MSSETTKQGNGRVPEAAESPAWERDGRKRRAKQSPNELQRHSVGMLVAHRDGVERALWTMIEGMRQDGVAVHELALALGLTHTTFYRHLRMASERYGLRSESDGRRRMVTE